MISTILLLGLLTAISLLVIGGFILATIQKKSISDPATQELEHQLSQALKTTFGRVLSASLQLILYTGLLLMALSVIHHSDWAKEFVIFEFLYGFKPSGQQLIAFVMGGIMSTGFALALYLKPFRISALMLRNQETIEKGSTSIFLAAMAIGFLGTGLLMTGILSCIAFFGPNTLIGFGVGTVFSAFFLRLGGGLYKTATDISSQIISAQEKEIPSFDARNPLTILHISSRFMSGLFGFSSDIMSSFSLAIIAVITLSVTPLMQLIFGGKLSHSIMAYGLLIIITSMLAAALGSITTMFRMKKNRSTNSLLEGLYVSLIVIAVSAYIFSIFLQLEGVFVPVLIGIFGAIFVGFTAEILTSHHYKTAKQLAKGAEYGAATTFLGGYSSGLMSTPIFIVYGLVILGGSYAVSGIMGSMMAILGFLSPTAFILIMTAFKPLSLTLQDVNSLSLNDSVITHNAKKLQLLAHTTAAIGNGYAATAATLSAVGLLATLFYNYLDTFERISPVTGIIVFLMGSTLPALCNSLLLKKLISAIKGLVSETVRQFREIPYLFEHKARPDVVKAADTHARTCMDALALPASLLVIPPIFLTAFLGSNALILYILGAILLSALQSVSFANTGDVLNHAKQLIGEGRYGGKEAAPYAHASVADTIGDAFKDLLSPNMNIVIKGLLIIGTLLLNFLI